MTDNLHNREILAAWIEEKPTSLTYYVIRDRDYSEGRAWIREQMYDGSIGWIPFNPYKDEAACTILLEKMPEPQIWIESDRGVEPKIWGCCDIGDPEKCCAFSASRKEAIAAACLQLIGQPSKGE